MDTNNLLELFSERENQAKQCLKVINFDNYLKIGTIHEDITQINLKSVLAEADKICPTAADTIRWLILHEFLRAQWCTRMAKELYY